MRILILSQYFAPEVTAARLRLQPIAQQLAEHGHKVDVVCEVPNHPEGVVHDGFRWRPLVQRKEKGFTVRHVWVKTSPLKTPINRLLLYGSFAFTSTVIGSMARRPDLIFASSPPLPAAAAAAALAKRFRVPWVMDVRDPWPEAAVAVGEVSNRNVIRMLERLESALYKSAAAIVTVTEPFRADIAGKVEDPEKITVIPNGTTREWLAAGEAEVDRAELGLPSDRFVWTYAGNIGLAQGLKAAVDAASQLGDCFQLQLIGDGPMKVHLEERASGFPPGLVNFQGLVAPEIAARYLRASDATLVSLGAKPELVKFVPSKLFDCCAVGRPVILSAKGEAQHLTEESRAALPVPPGDPDALAQAVRRLADDPRLSRELGDNARTFAASHLRELQVDRLEALFETLV